MITVNNIESLRCALQQEQVREDSYSLENEWPDDAYVLTSRNAIWKVYYSERGVAIGERDFKSEEEACKYLYEKLLADKTTRLSK